MDVVVIDLKKIYDLAKIIWDLPDKLIDLIENDKRTLLQKTLAGIYNTVYEEFIMIYPYDEKDYNRFLKKGYEPKKDLIRVHIQQRAFYDDQKIIDILTTSIFFKEKPSVGPFYYLVEEECKSNELITWKPKSLTEFIEKYLSALNSSPTLRDLLKGYQWDRIETNVEQLKFIVRNILPTISYSSPSATIDRMIQERSEERDIEEKIKRLILELDRDDEYEIISNYFSKEKLFVFNVSADHLPVLFIDTILHNKELLDIYIVEEIEAKKSNLLFKIKRHIQRLEVIPENYILIVTVFLMKDEAMELWNRIKNDIIDFVATVNTDFKIFIIFMSDNNCILYPEVIERENNFFTKLQYQHFYGWLDFKCASARLGIKTKWLCELKNSLTQHFKQKSELTMLEIYNTLLQIIT